MNKFNRKFKRILASSLLGAFYCSQNTIVGYVSELHKVTPGDRREIYDAVSLFDKGENKTVNLMDGKKLTISYSHLRSKILEGYNEFLPISYKYDGMSTYREAILVYNWKAKTVYVVPNDDTILELLPKNYDKLGDDYKLSRSGNEDKWWDKTQECIDHLKALDLDSKTNKTDKNDKARRNNDTFIDEIARYLGLSRWQTIGLILGGGIVIIGGAVWILKSLLSSVGKAGSDIIHGSNDKNSEKQFVQIPIASSLAPAPAPIIINNK